jgi:hypothetical protein
MALEAKIDKLIDKLTELTHGDKVIWQDTADENAFLTAVGNSTVVVGRLRSDPGAPYFIRVLDDTGKTIEEATAFVDVSETLSSSSIIVNMQKYLRDKAIQDWAGLGNLYELARRSALKSDKVISDLLSSLEAIK